MSSIKQAAWGIFGFVITLLVGMIAWTGERQIVKLDTIVTQQQQHLVEFAVVNNEVGHIKKNIEKIDKEVHNLNNRSKLYWPEWEHLAQEQEKEKRKHK